MEDPNWLSIEIPEMAQAMRAARASFAEFSRHAELELNRIVPAFDCVLVKVFIASKSDPLVGEYHFLSDVLIRKNFLVGSLNGESSTLGLQMGEPIVAEYSQICDWIINIDSNAHHGGIGGFVIDVLKGMIPPEDRHEYESDPPVSWYVHRNQTGLTAQAELDQVPVCQKCGQKALFNYGYVEGVCMHCVEDGLQRVDCEVCGVPLMRHATSPRICKGCCKSESSPVTGEFAHMMYLKSQFAEMSDDADPQEQNEESSPQNIVEGSVILELDEACENEDIERLRELFEQHPEARHDQAFLNELLTNGLTCPVEILDCLEENGADVHHLPDPTTAESLVWTAVLLESVHGVKWLIDRGVPVNTLNTEPPQCTALWIAASDGNLSIAKLLVENGAAVNTINQVTGKNSLSEAMQRGHEEVVAYLRSVGAKTPAELGWSQK